MASPTDPTGYRQLADILRAEITGGGLKAGRNLPSERALAQRYGLAHGTVRRAIAVLRAEGLIDSRQGYAHAVRAPAEVTYVTVPAGTTAGARMPTPDERAEWGMPDGTPMVVAHLPDGMVQAWPADRYRLRPDPG